MLGLMMVISDPFKDIWILRVLHSCVKPCVSLICRSRDWNIHLREWLKIYGINVGIYSMQGPGLAWVSVNPQKSPDL